MQDIFGCAKKEFKEVTSQIYTKLTKLIKLIKLIDIVELIVLLKIIELIMLIMLNNLVVCNNQAMDIKIKKISVQDLNN